MCVAAMSKVPDRCGTAVQQVKRENSGPWQNPATALRIYHLALAGLGCLDFRASCSSSLTHIGSAGNRPGLWEHGVFGLTVNLWMETSLI